MKPLNPTNVVDMGGAGIDSLRAKSGIGERQVTEAASDVKSIDDAAAGVNQAADFSSSRCKSINVDSDNTVIDLNMSYHPQDVVDKRYRAPVMTIMVMKVVHQGSWQLLTKLIFQASVQHLENF